MQLTVVDRAGIAVALAPAAASAFADDYERVAVDNLPDDDKTLVVHWQSLTCHVTQSITLDRSETRTSLVIDRGLPNPPDCDLKPVELAVSITLNLPLSPELVDSAILERD